MLRLQGAQAIHEASGPRLPLGIGMASNVLAVAPLSDRVLQRPNRQASGVGSPPGNADRGGCQV